MDFLRAAGSEVSDSIENFVRCDDGLRGISVGVGLLLCTFGTIHTNDLAAFVDGLLV